MPNRVSNAWQGQNRGRGNARNVELIVTKTRPLDPADYELINRVAELAIDWVSRPESNGEEP
jgi:hypothetical protein